MENHPSLAINGVAVRYRECPKCSRRDAPGVEFTREMDGRKVFKCDICGQKRSLGWDEAHALQIDSEAAGYQRAIGNRERWQREFDEKFAQDYNRATENLTVTPDIVEHWDELQRGPGIAQREKMEEYRNRAI